MQDVLKDLRQGLKLLVQKPSFTFVVAATLALAVGANTVIFSIVDVVALRPLPFKDVDRIVFLYNSSAERSVERGPVSTADFLDWREQARSFEALGVRTSATYTMTGRGLPLKLQATRVSANQLDIWGTGAMAGRLFLPGEDAPGAQPVVVLSHGFWVRQFGADPRILGQALVLNSEPHTVIGVLTPDIEIGNFSLIDIWTPLSLDRHSARRDEHTLSVSGLLEPGATLEQADAEIKAIVGRLEAEHPETNAGWSARALPLKEAMMGKNAWLALGLLVVVVTLVLLIACANVANLMLAQATARQKEMAVRVALGASRIRVVRQLVTESLLLGLLGGGGGVLVAVAGLRLIAAASYEPFFKMLAVDLRALAFVTVLSILTPLLFSLLPAIHAARTDLIGVLKEGGQRAAGGARGRRGRAILVVSQLSLALTLLVVAGLIVRDVSAVLALDLGYDETNVLSFRVELDQTKYPNDERVILFQQDLLTRLAALPGVETVAAVDSIPVLDGDRTTQFTIEGRPIPKPNEVPWAARAVASPAYLNTLRIPLRQGRALLATDSLDTAPVAMINAEMARRYWPGENPIGKRIKIGGEAVESPWTQIVGVVDNLRPADIDLTVQPQLYLPLAQQPARGVAFLVRTEGSPANMAAAARRQVQAADPDLAAYDVRTLEQALREEYASDRVLAGMFSAFALVALLLAATGLYGVMAYSVSQRSQEIGVRMALGAKAGDVVGLVVRQAAVLIVVGAVIGLAGGALLGQVLRSALSRVGPFDPVTFASVLALLTMVTVVASYVPARRAAAVDPITTLRAE